MNIDSVVDCIIHLAFTVVQINCLEPVNCDLEKRVKWTNPQI